MKEEINNIYADIYEIRAVIEVVVSQQKGPGLDS